MRLSIEHVCHGCSDRAILELAAPCDAANAPRHCRHQRAFDCPCNVAFDRSSKQLESGCSAHGTKEATSESRLERAAAQFGEYAARSSMG